MLTYIHTYAQTCTQNTHWHIHNFNFIKYLKVVRRTRGSEQEYKRSKLAGSHYVQVNFSEDCKLRIRRQLIEIASRKLRMIFIWTDYFYNYSFDYSRGAFWARNFPFFIKYLKVVRHTRGSEQENERSKLAGSHCVKVIFFRRLQTLNLRTTDRNCKPKIRIIFIGTDYFNNKRAPVSICNG